MTTSEKHTSKTWLVTGASRGLGSQIVRAALAAGDRVVAGVRNVDSAELGSHEALRVVRLDVTDESQVQAAVATSVEQLGGLDVVVNNAGRHMRGAVEEVSDAEARAVFDVNVFGILTVLRTALPILREQRSGHVINIGSGAGLVGLAGAGLYNATKFAVSGLTEALAIELADFNIHVTVVEPGGFRTDFLDPSSMVSAEPMAAYDSTPAGIVHREKAAVGNHQQPGDPAKAAKLIVDVSHHDDPPVHLLVGMDAIAAWENVKIPLMNRSIDPWRERSKATGF
jgi:NAD(P)-dependent dehydrogenase (short-subunit alcohol dehydrogenase family)